MKTTADFLDTLRSRLVCSSDADLGERMKWKPAQVSRYRTLQSTFSDETALRVAELCDVEPGYMFACMKAQQATQPEIKKVWQLVAEKFRDAAIVAAMSIGAASFGGFNNNAFANPSGSLGGNALTSGTDYTLRNNRRRWWEVLP